LCICNFTLAGVFVAARYNGNKNCKGGDCGMNILLVDDEEEILDLLGDLLLKRNYNVLKAQSGELALELLRNNEVDLVLLDIMMKGMSGLSVLEIIRKDDKLKTISVIIVSALSDSNNRINGLSLGADDYISKPFDREEFLARINTHLKLQSLRKELLEKERAANKELEAFSYSLAHDMRSLLIGIKNNAELLQISYSDRLDAEGKDILNWVTTSSSRMNMLITDTLEFSRLVHQELKKEEIDIAQLCKDIFEELKKVHSGRKIELKIDVIPSSQGDKSMLRQVFVNLLSNALKFSRTRDIAVIEVGAISKDKEIIYFVKDNGVGFDSTHADKLFDVFMRYHKQEEFEGTGVGLSIVNRVVQRHHGRVWAESKVNEGAKFYFALPKITSLS